MYFTARNLIAWLALACLIGATAWALHFPAEPPADFVYVNGAEPKSLDPARVSGQPEGRIIEGLFEGLTRINGKTLAADPGMADRWEISADKRQYTFHIRPEARWSDGTLVTAADFLWSHQRLLDPQTASEYSYVLWYVKNAKQYTSGEIKPGDRVEVELNRLPPRVLPFARGELLKGQLVSATKDDSQPPRSAYVVEIDGRQQTFQQGDGPDDCKQVLLDFEQVGFKAIDERTYQITLDYPTSYFLSILTMYPTFPVNRRCVETFGSPAWLKPENIVTNGGYLLKDRRIRERIRLVKSPTYWDRDNVRINTIDVLAVESSTTALNLYLTGDVDCITNVPPAIMQQLLDQHRDDFHPSPALITEFYQFNVKMEPVDDQQPLANKLVRQALAMAVNKQQIVEGITRGGEVPLRNMVPPAISQYMPYQPALCPEYNPEKAARLLAEAGYPEGRGFPKLAILYNSDERHQMLAELIQRQWKETLGINVEPQNMDWSAMEAAVHNKNYAISRSGWVGDYVDPNTFLDMFQTDNENNNTNWGDLRYDKLIEQAAQTQDQPKRLKLLHDAEAILMDEMPIIPLYDSVTRNMVRPYVQGFYENVLDEHPFPRLGIDLAARRAFLDRLGRGAPAGKPPEAEAAR